MFYKKTNFKETPIGYIPSEWSVVSVEDLGEVVTGTTPSTSVKDYWDGKYPFVTPTDMTESKYVEKTERGITEQGLQKGRLIPKDSVLVTCIASIGKIALAFEPCITNQQINAVICKQGVNPHYVYYAIAFRSNVLRAWAGRTTNPIVKKSLFEQFPLALPRNVTEQQKIAEVLSTVDKAIQKTSEVIAKTERLKKGLTQGFLTKGIGHREFKDSEIGRIPKEWKVMKLGDVGKFQYGITTSAVKEHTGVNLLRITDITDNGIKWETVPHCKLTEAQFEKYKLELGDVLFARIGATTGKTCYIDQPVKGVFGSYLIRFQPELEIDKAFLYFWTQSERYWHQVNRKKEGQLKKGLNTRMLGGLLLPLPPFQEQRKIAETLSTVDKKLELERKEKARLERIKQGLMDLLLTGKVRVKVH